MPITRAQEALKKLPILSAAEPLAPSRQVAGPVDSQFLKSLPGYNARRASLAIIEAFYRDMAPFDFGPVDFSVMSIIAHNPGITSRQLCMALSLLPPNLVGLINRLEKRGLITRQPHPSDGRALGLYCSPHGRQITEKAEAAAAASGAKVTQKLTSSEHKTLIRLLQKIFL
jgi:DNA-binding MarR family transcriptional regulator